MDLPSLTALRAFEAASRTGGFSAAARELNVTHAAISQQVRALEAHLGLTLIYREGRGLALTDEGAQLAQTLKDSFGAIADTLTDMTEAEDARPLRVSITPSFAAQWLMPRLGSFWAKYPEIALSLIPDQRVVDLKAERIDLAIRFGKGEWTGVETEALVPAYYTVVGAPSLVGERKALTPEEMSDLPWILEEKWPEQYAWLKSIGVDLGDPARHKYLNDQLAPAAARQGYGLCVRMSGLLDDDINSGRLRVVYESCKNDGVGYWLVTKPGLKKPALKTLIRWLKSVV